MQDIAIGDEVLCHCNHLYARVEEVFPAAVCVKLVALDGARMRLAVRAQLWRAEDIENLSVCRYCGGRDGLRMEDGACVPFRVCATCLSIRETSLSDDERPPTTDHRPLTTTPKGHPPPLTTDH